MQPELRKRDSVIFIYRHLRDSFETFRMWLLFWEKKYLRSCLIRSSIRDYLNRSQMLLFLSLTVYLAMFRSMCSVHNVYYCAFPKYLQSWRFLTVIAVYEILLRLVLCCHHNSNVLVVFFFLAYNTMRVNRLLHNLIFHVFSFLPPPLFLLNPCYL